MGHRLIVKLSLVGKFSEDITIIVTFNFYDYICTCVFLHLEETHEISCEKNTHDNRLTLLQRLEESKCHKSNM